MISLQDFLHDTYSDLQPPSSSGSLLSSQYLGAYSEPQSSPCSSYHSADSQPHGIINPEKDAGNILAFIAALNTVSRTNETGWTYEKATLALDEKCRRLEAGIGDHDTEHPPFDFFSHFNPALRNHLRHSYDRRKRWGYTGDAQRGLSLLVAALQEAKLRDLINMIGVAIDLRDAIEVAINTPARELHGQVLRRKDREDTERANRELDEFDGRFEGTWKGVLSSTIALGSVACKHVRKKISDQ
jgi:hypothetical protein